MEAAPSLKARIMKNWVCPSARGSMEAASLKARFMKKTGQAQMQAATDLLIDKRKMLNNKDYSDVAFLCMDGERVHACRILLCARSTVLSSMLTNGMVESRKSEITLPDISSSVLLAIFEFLYTGMLLEHEPGSWRKALEIISAARFFLLQNLEDIVWEFLVEYTFEVPIDVTIAANNLSLAMDFPTLFETMDIIPLELVRILNSKCLEPVHLRVLSEKAFRYLLSKTRRENIDSGRLTLSLGEYLRFRQVIMWCACQTSADIEEAEEVVKLYLPDAKGSLQYLRDTPQTDEEFQSPSILRKDSQSKAGSDDTDVNQDDQFAKLKNSISTSVTSLLELVDLRRVHPELLINVLEPLDIIPRKQLVAAFRFHALQRPRVVKGTWEDGAHSSFYRIGKDLSVIEKCDHGIGFARASNAICQPYGVYVWDIIIEQLSYQFCEIGIYKQFGKPDFDGASFTQQANGWALRMDDRGTSINQWNVLGCPWTSYGKRFGYQGARVRLHLDMFNLSCSFSIDGEDFGPAWNNLPEGIYYPAVSLGSGALGRVRIELVSGFDLL